MLHSAVLGAAAGAVGTIALDVATYADMVLRGRPASEVPAKLAGKLTDRLGIDLSGDQEGKEGEETAQSRRSGIGALFGYATGLAIGTAYGLLRPQPRGFAVLLAGAIVGLAAMAVSDIPIAASGVSDPREWSASDWAADAIPHLAYGLVTVLAFAGFDDE